MEEEDSTAQNNFKPELSPVVTENNFKQPMEAEDSIADNNFKPEPFQGIVGASRVEAEQGCSISPNHFVNVPVDIAVSWEPPKPDQGCSNQNLAVFAVNSEKLDNGSSSKMELDCVLNTDDSLVNVDESAVNTDMTTEFTTDQVFNSRMELINWCQEVGKKLMTVVVVTKSEYTIQGGRKPRLYLGCERGGVFRDHRKKSDLQGRQIRRTGTKRCGCPFILQGMKQDEADQWKLEVRCGVHNHPIDRTPVGHTYAGRLSEEEIQLVLDMSKNGVRPRDVLTTIKERNKRSAATLSTIYNTRAKLRMPEIDRTTAIQELMKLALKNQYYVEWCKKDQETNEVKDIFWANPEALQILKCFPSVLMVDCTCKTNKFKMPLFEIVGAASTGKTITIAFVIVEAEGEDNYVWVMSRLKSIFDPKSLPGVFVTDGELTLMNAIATVFPNATHLVCTQHISRNLTIHFKKNFETDQEFDSFLNDWTNLTKSETQIEFLDRLAAFEMTWANFPNCLAYLRENWLSEHKEHFVSAWTNLVKHYGNTTISRTESAHSRLKMLLTSSQGTIGTIWMSMQSMVNGEIIDVKASLKKSLSTVQPSQELDPLNELRGSISHLALDLIGTEISKSIAIDADACRCAIRQTHGLPCAHEIVQFTSEGRMIPLPLIDSHWKKLSVIPTPEIHSLLNYEPEYRLLTEKWEESSEEQRMHLLKKIKELASTDSSCLNEPVDAEV